LLRVEGKVEALARSSFFFGVVTYPLESMSYEKLVPASSVV
jgi:hypothetical protein